MAKTPAAIQMCHIKFAVLITNSLCCSSAIAAFKFEIADWTFVSFSNNFSTSTLRNVVAILVTISKLVFLVNSKSKFQGRRACGLETGNKVKNNKLVQFAARSVVKAGDLIQRNGKKLVVAGATAFGSGLALATDPDATVIATNAQTAFDTIAPITITIVGFYVIVNLARRVLG
jgi:hypothetical protein